MIDYSAVVGYTTRMTIKERMRAADIQSFSLLLNAAIEWRSTL